ncbi:MAG: hypothetical protein A2289_06640 [Deltaproteobacteria bacterium RIFOXYA12_FULL_58_15]|nr:MAG: hypothetical protein A2289_06640 [Deltaproteobacteria bacterium RIFOXYA12_FULL_58_15]
MPQASGWIMRRLAFLLCLLALACTEDDYAQLYKTKPQASSYTEDEIANLQHLGSTVVDQGVNFGVYSEHATRIELLVFVDREESDNGRLWREHYDSIFANTNGSTDSRGLENGDTDARFTWQIKSGIVVNPLGPGIYTRPSLRILYGLQYSNVHNAFGNNFASSLDQNDQFPEREDHHWRSVIAIEGEGWF